MPPVNKPTTSKDERIAKFIDHSTVDKPKVASINGRPILYPHYHVKICCAPRDGKEYDGPISYAMMKKILRWETESEYTARVLKANPKLKESKAKFGDNYLLKNYAGEKVRCWNNARNRPFDENHARSLGQDMLNKNYEMNCENFIIGETGIVISGQHRGCGFMLAVEEWRASKLKGDAVGHWQEIWPEEPYIETMIAFGCKEDPKIIRTIDNVKARTLADTIYTSPIFESLNSVERKECSRMMDAAVDLLYKRTKQKDAWNKFQTHSTSLEFLDRHPKIRACVKQLFDCNRDRVISNLGLSAGQAAAMMYLMGCSNTDQEDYYYPGSPKKEEQLNWDNWDNAVAFWSGMINRKNERMDPIRKALGKLIDPNTGASVPQKVYHMLLSMAWNSYVEDLESPIAEVDLDVGVHLKFSEAKERTIIVEEPIVGGIDCGVVKNGGEEDEVLPSPEEQEAEKEKIKAEQEAKRIAELDQKAKTKPKKAEEEEPSNPLVESKNQSSTKGKPVFSPEERAKLLSHVKPKIENKEEPKPAAKKVPPKPILKPKS